MADNITKQAERVSSAAGAVRTSATPNIPRPAQPQVTRQAPVSSDTSQTRQVRQAVAQPARQVPPQATRQVAQPVSSDVNQERQAVAQAEPQVAQPRRQVTRQAEPQSARQYQEFTPPGWGFWGWFFSGQSATSRKSGAGMSPAERGLFGLLGAGGACFSTWLTEYFLSHHIPVFEKAEAVTTVTTKTVKGAVTAAASFDWGSTILATAIGAMFLGVELYFWHRKSPAVWFVILAFWATSASINISSLHELLEIPALSFDVGSGLACAVGLGAALLPALFLSASLRLERR